MLVIRCYNVAAVSLTHVYEVDLQGPFDLYFGFFDVAVHITAAHLDVFHFHFLFDNYFSHIVAANHLGLDIVAEKQLFGKNHFFNTFFGVEFRQSQFNGRIDSVSYFDYFRHRLDYWYV